MKNYMFFVEGVHDASCVGKVLKLNGFEECRFISDLPKIWQDRVPKSYPFEIGKLERFTPIPDYYVYNDIFVVIVVSNGEQNIIKEVDLYLSNMNKKELNQINGIGMIFDADQVTPNEKIKNLLKSIDKKEYCFRSDDFMRGIIRLRGENLKLHYYFFPDNHSSGTLEDLLLEGADIVYSDLLINVDKYICKVDERYKENWSISSENKARVGCIANIFRPASANQISIMRDDWISKESMEHSINIKHFYEFITNIIFDKEY
ncbi:MAG: DUF3226 domain-containing protein [Peptostreptococcaceae bacterium]